jgi:hypothetical protein
VRIHASKGKLDAVAKEEMLITCGGAYIRLTGGKIDLHCPGPISFKAGNHVSSGPASMSVQASSPTPKTCGGSDDEAVQGAGVLALEPPPASAVTAQAPQPSAGEAPETAASAAGSAASAAGSAASAAGAAASAAGAAASAVSSAANAASNVASQASSAVASAQNIASNAASAVNTVQSVISDPLGTIQSAASDAVQGAVSGALDSATGAATDALGSIVPDNLPGSGLPTDLPVSTDKIAEAAKEKLTDAVAEKAQAAAKEKLADAIPGKAADVIGKIS